MDKWAVFGLARWPGLDLTAAPRLGYTLPISPKKPLVSYILPPGTKGPGWA